MGKQLKIWTIYDKSYFGICLIDKKLNQELFLVRGLNWESGESSGLMCT
jgi:hypothetical protein